jgi:hypothetical protein
VKFLDLRKTNYCESICQGLARAVAVMLLAYLLSALLAFGMAHNVAGAQAEAPAEATLSFRNDLAGPVIKICEVVKTPTEYHPIPTCCEGGDMLTT